MGLGADAGSAAAEEPEAAGFEDADEGGVDAPQATTPDNAANAAAASQNFPHEMDTLVRLPAG